MDSNSEQSETAIVRQRSDIDVASCSLLARVRTRSPFWKVVSSTLLRGLTRPGWCFRNCICRYRRELPQMFIYLDDECPDMVTVTWNKWEEQYNVMRRGTVHSRHNTSSAAKRAGRRLGRKYDEPVSYQGPRMNTAKFL